jgi:hypothetical protein
MSQLNRRVNNFPTGSGVRGAQISSFFSFTSCKRKGRRR